MTGQDQRDVDREMLMAALNIQSSLAGWALEFSAALKRVVILLWLMSGALFLVCLSLVFLIVAQ